mgnify:CR=1 FL=1
MALTQLAPPYPVFTDKNGDPLDNGYLYFGEVDKNPETDPIQVYYDSRLTQPVAQPIRTSNGYVMRNGAPALIYAGSQFSVTVRDKNSDLVIYSPVGYGIDPGAIAGVVIVQDQIGDGVTTAFGMGASPATENATNVFIDGVYQSKAGYSISGTTLTFSEAPPLYSAIEIVSNETAIVGGTDAGLVTYNEGGLGAVTRTVKRRLQDFVSVKDFGAVGDGVADDTAAIQAAIDTDRSVYFPSGTYIVDQIVDAGSDHILHFNGGATLKKSSSSTNLYVLQLTGTNITVENAIIDGNGTAFTVSDTRMGLRMEGSGNKAVRCISHTNGFYDAGSPASETGVGTGFSLNSSTSQAPNILLDCISYNNKNYGMSGDTNIIIRGGSTYNNGTNGVGGRFGNNIIIDGLHIGAQKVNGVSNGILWQNHPASNPDYQKTTFDVRVQNCVIEGQEDKSISATRYGDFILANNIIKGNVLIQSANQTAASQAGEIFAVIMDSNIFEGAVFEFINNERVYVDNCQFKNATSLEFDSPSSKNVETIISGCSFGNLQVIVKNAPKVCISNSYFEDNLLCNICENVTITGCNFVKEDAAADDDKGLHISNVDTAAISGCSFEGYGLAIKIATLNDAATVTGCTFLDCNIASPGVSVTNGGIYFHGEENIAITGNTFNNVNRCAKGDSSSGKYTFVGNVNINGTPDNTFRGTDYTVVGNVFVSGTLTTLGTYQSANNIS